MTNNDEINFRGDVLLTFQVALLGMIVPSLRGVTVGWDSKKIIAKCFYDGEIGDEEAEMASEVETEIYASYPDHEVEVRAFRLDYPVQLNPHVLQAWVYCRKE